MQVLEKKYGFWTATAMVVGIVIGSGVFFKADDVLIAAGGSLPTALRLPWSGPPADGICGHLLPGNPQRHHHGQCPGHVFHRVTRPGPQSGDFQSGQPENRRHSQFRDSGVLPVRLVDDCLVRECSGLVGQIHGYSISELPIAFLYVIYIAFCIWVMREYRDLGPFSRFLAPLLAATESVYITWGAIQKDMFIHFVIITAAIMMSGLPFMQAKQRAPRVRAEIAVTCRYNRLDGPERKTD